MNKIIDFVIAQLNAEELAQYNALLQNLETEEQSDTAFAFIALCRRIASRLHLPEGYVSSRLMLSNHALEYKLLKAR